MKESERLSGEQSWRGAPLESVYRGENVYDLQHFPAVDVSVQSTVLYELPVEDSAPPKPFLRIPAKWDKHHVRLPNAEECRCLKDNALEVATDARELRWEQIKQAFTAPIETTKELQDAILIYNPEFKEKWNFQALHALLEQEFSTEDKENFFNELLPRIIKLALQLPELIQGAIPLLTQNTTHSLSLTQQQVSCLLANAFLCTFPFRSSFKRRQPKHSEYYTYPEINFNRLFQTLTPGRTEKIKCLLNYFQRVCPTTTDSSNVPNGVVTFIRRSLNADQFPEWSACEKCLDKTILHIDAAGVIEDGIGLLQVDFANKYVGGGVLGFGCVQEEIRFSVNPELIVAMLFTEFLLPNEALFMIGCEQYNKYSGYGASFKWIGDHIDETPRDSSKRRKTQIVAINALSFRQPKDQFKDDFMLRELNKAYVGFLYELPEIAPGIATGNWGCGAFRGEPRLKALLQLMVACVTDRPLAYYTFFDTALRDEAFEIYEFFKSQKTCVSDLWYVLKEFHSRDLDSKALYGFVKSQLLERFKT